MRTRALDSREVEDRLRELRPVVRKAVGWIGRRLPSDVDRGDLLAAGMLGAWQTIVRHGDKPRDAFLKLAKARILGAIRDELRTEMHKTRRAEHHPRFVYLDATTGERPTDSVWRKLGANDPAFDEFERRDELSAASETLRAAMARLRPRDRELIELAYLQEVPHEEIARRWRVTPPRVAQVHKRVLGELRKLLRSMS